jgi:threonine/homoserine/homoserine lactone efflux protein
VHFFMSSLLIGFSIAAVVGPIGVLCIHRTLHRGFFYGMVTGLGAATADAVYGSIAGFGLTVIAAFLVNQMGWIHIVGGLFLIYLGIKTLLSSPAKRAADTREATSFFSAYISTFLLTLTNPSTIISFVAIFAGIGVGTGGGDPIAALLVVVGVFLGSAFWWLILAGGMSFLRTKFSPAWLPWVNRLSGCIILLFGAYALLSFRW